MDARLGETNRLPGSHCDELTDYRLGGRARGTRSKRRLRRYVIALDGCKAPHKVGCTPHSIKAASVVYALFNKVSYYRHAAQPSDG
jgi:hypothetical protein